MFLFLVINKIISYVDYLSSATCIAFSHEGKSACQPLKAGARSFDLPSATCIASSHESKSAYQPLKAGARSFDLPSANIWINLYITKYFCDFLIINHKKTDFRSVYRLVMMKNIIIGVQ